LVLAVLVVSATACSGDQADELAAGTVIVTVTGIEESVGHDVAAVMYDGLWTDNPGVLGMVGGFGVVVDADPFAVTQTIASPASDQNDVDTQFPGVSDEPLIVEPGQYTIMIWIDEELGPYSRWVPADSPGLGGCRVDVTVEEGRSTSVTVDGIPDWTLASAASTSECATQ
jgi:hypothetical protein